MNWNSPELRSLLQDPIKFKNLCWPDLKFYDKQVEIVYSVRDNDETIVPAGNMLGKDFIAGFCALWFFCSRSPCRVLTTSVDHSQLKGVLWGEIRRFIQTSKYKLPTADNDLLLRQDLGGQLEPRSYLMGRVAKQGEGLLGHHAERGPNNAPSTLAIFDEASGILDQNSDATDTWCHRKLVIGNCYPCDNFFRKGVKGGTLLSEDKKTVYRKVIKIRAEDSPNVRLALKEISLGLEPSHRQIVDGVLSYRDYCKRRELWDPIRQCIGLDANFWEGGEFFLCPQAWLDRAEKIDSSIIGPRKARAMGVDPAEGGDNSCWCIVDDYGIIELISKQTTDTSVIGDLTITLMHKHGLQPNQIWFDRGGGGKEHADYLKRIGIKVNTVGFGERPTDTAKEKRFKSKQDRKEKEEHQYVYKNKRAEMYGIIRQVINPDLNPEGFGIPSILYELRRQLNPIPLQFDAEGRMYLPPKDKKNKDSKEVTLKELLGCSPDEADSLALALYGLKTKLKIPVAGAY